MDLEYSVDLISDLNLSKTEQFDWSGKPTSLFCIVAGNISSDTRKIKETLEHLGTIYRGVLYIDGPLEHTDVSRHEERVERLTELCQPLKNVIYMHNHVVVLNNIAFVGVNGWYGAKVDDRSFEENFIVTNIQNEDLGYLSQTIRNLQLHRDANKIVVISSSLPADAFLYRHFPCDLVGIEPALSLVMDTDHKVTHWLYGGDYPECDTVYNGRRYVNNPKTASQPYWPKRIVL